MVRKKDNVRVLQLFPTEKLEIYAPYEESQPLQGIFILAFIAQKRLPQKISIKAVHRNTAKDVELEYMHNCVYRGIVEGIGIFYFVADSRQSIFLKRKEQNRKLSLLIPINEEFFEQACKERHFFFVGE